MIPASIKDKVKRILHIVSWFKNLRPISMECDSKLANFPIAGPSICSVLTAAQVLVTHVPVNTCPRRNEILRSIEDCNNNPE